MLSVKFGDFYQLLEWAFSKKDLEHVGQKTDYYTRALKHVSNPDQSKYHRLMAKHHEATGEKNYAAIHRHLARHFALT